MVITKTKYIWTNLWAHWTIVLPKEVFLCKFQVKIYSGLYFVRPYFQKLVSKNWYSFTLDEVNHILEVQAKQKYLVSSFHGLFFTYVVTKITFFNHNLCTEIQISS